MRRFLPLAVLVAITLGGLSASATASRIRFNPGGAIRATAPLFVVEVMGFFSIGCEMTLTGEVSREAEGTLNMLGSIVAGRFNRAEVEVEECIGGTMRVELTNAAIITVKEATNRTRVELWILNVRILIEEEGRRFRCLYELLMRATSRENPILRLEFVHESLLGGARTLAGSMVCLNEVRSAGFFTLGARLEAMLS